MSIASFAPDPHCPGAFTRAMPRHDARLHQRPFGRARVRILEPLEQPAALPRIPGDLKLFAGTFLAGFVFVSALIA